MSQPRKSFRTEKGTELPLLNLKGKEYLQVMHRLAWFKEKYPEENGVIKTQMIEHQGQGKDEYFIFRAEIFIKKEQSMILVATGHKRESVGGFADAMEKAESGAIGRALAMMGIGTVFAADDLDEGNRLADSPAPVLDRTETKTTGSPTLDNVGTGSGATVLPAKRTSFRKNVSAMTEKTASTGDDI